MNILFISKLSGTLWKGPNNSVPAQVYVQSKIDNVLWFNLSKQTSSKWKEQGLPILTTDDIPSSRLKDLPYPFNKPDLVVVEEVYPYRFNYIISDIQKAKIPYIIIPRSQLTKQGQKRKPIKKWLGNLLYYKKLVKKSSAIQYLTKQEQKDSGEKWNKNFFILPNGINMPNIGPKSFSQDGINIVFIGRLERYQKGLDLLIEVCCKIRQELHNAKVKIHLYGPNRFDTIEILSKTINKFVLGNIISFCPAVFTEEKTKVLQQADAFIMTSRFEGHPMGLIEALSYGLPCLVTTGTNMKEEIEKFDAGWTADTTVDSIAEALKKMIAEKNLFEQKSINARKLASQYNWDTIAQKSHEIYERIIRK